MSANLIYLGLLNRVATYKFRNDDKQEQATVTVFRWDDTKVLAGYCLTDRSYNCEHIKQPLDDAIARKLDI